MFFLRTQQRRATRSATMRLLAMGSVLAISLAACTPATGILYIIENETPVFNAEHGLPKTSLISGLLSDGTSYFAKGSLIYVASVPSGTFTHYNVEQNDELNRTPITNWAKLNNPNSDVSLADAAVSGNTIYAIFIPNASGGSGGFFSVSDVNNGNAGSKTWSGIALTGLPSGARLESVDSINGNILVQTSSKLTDSNGNVIAEGRKYSLYLYNGSFTEIVPQGGVDAATFLPFIDIKWDGSQAVMLKRTAVYASTNLSDFSKENTGYLPDTLYKSNDKNTENPDPGYTALAVDGTDWYIGSARGFVMAKVGGTWKHSSSLQNNSSGTAYSVSSLAFARMTDVGIENGSFDRLIVGTKTNGMLYVNDDCSFTTWQTMDGYSGSYIGTNLYRGGITDIYVSADTFQIFVSTSAYGLYSAVFDGTPSTTSNPTTPGLQWSSE